MIFFSEDGQEAEEEGGGDVEGASKKKKKKKKKKTGGGGGGGNVSDGTKQTDPPTIPISELYPDGNFPVGEEVEYPDVDG